MPLKTVYGFLTDSIRKKLIISVVLFIIIPVTVLYFYTFDYFKKIFIENATQSALTNMSAARLILDNTLERMMTTAKYISLDSSVNVTLKESGKNSELNVNNLFAIEKLFSNIEISYLNQYYHITIIPSDGEIYSTWSRHYYNYSYFRNQKWYKNSILAGGAFIWVAPQEQYIRNDESKEKNLVSVATSIFDNYVTNNLGVVLVSINESELYSQIYSRELQDAGSELFIIDNDGVIISHLNKSLIGKNIDYYGFSREMFTNESGSRILKSNGGETLISYLYLKKTGWKIIQTIPYNKIIMKTKQLIAKVLLISIVLLLVIILVLLAFSSKITSPVKKLVRLMKKVENGDLNVEIKIAGTDEIYALGQAFNNMICKQKTLISEIAEEERMLAEEQRKKDELKLEMLMAQINPHFLFNTLNTIKWTAIMNGNDTVGNMVSNLGNLLEMSINRCNDTLTLKEEIENVKSYIYIQKIRFYNRFSTEFIVPCELEQCIVPKFILQPLVENSIIHGFEYMEYGGEIRISAYREDGNLVINIEDNGKGMEMETTEKLLNSRAGNTDKNRLSGIGVGNVNERIRLCYGKDYGINIKSFIDEGTCVSILLPCIPGGGAL